MSVPAKYMLKLRGSAHNPSLYPSFKMERTVREINREKRDRRDNMKNLWKRSKIIDN